MPLIYWHTVLAQVADLCNYGSSASTTMLANLASPTVTYNVEEVLIFRDGTTMTLGAQTIKRAADRPMLTHKTYRCEWEHDPSSAYRWTWFDHHEDLIAIIYNVEEV